MLHHYSGYFTINNNGLKQQEVDHCKAQNYLPAQNLKRSVRLDLTTERAIS